MEHDCATETAAGATLVTVRVRNPAAVPRRVRVRNELPGPVLPPRREGVPERGWDEDGFEGVVAAGGTRTLGYACPVPADGGSPVSVESLGRADADGADADLETEAIRALGRARPPADAVPTPDVAVPTDGATSNGSIVSDGTTAPDASPPGETSRAAAAASATRAGDDWGRSEPAEATDGGRPDAPNAVRSWLHAVEARVRRAERLTGATAADAAAVLETAGDVSDLPSAVADDERALRTVAARASELADRAAETDAAPVVDALGGL